MSTPRRAGWWAHTVRAAGWLYLAALAAFALLVDGVGERWWVSTLLLYAPRIVLLAPLPLLAPLIARHGGVWRALVVSAAACVLVVALMGPHVGRADRRPGGPTLRVLAWNVWYGTRGWPAIEREIDAAHADVVLLQAISEEVIEAARLKAKRSGLAFHAGLEFLVLSRYPIRDLFEPETGPGDVPSGFARFTLDTPLGLLDVYDVHPHSPTPGILSLRAEGPRSLLRGPRPSAVRAVSANAELRERQVAALANDAARARHPVIIAGDTNLPEGSGIYRRWLGRWQDGFCELGTGFGYTYPTDRLWPWLRLDRVLAGPELRFVGFSIGDGAASDHRPVVADLARR